MAYLMAHIIDNTKCTNDTEKFFNSDKTFEDAYAYVKDFTVNRTYQCESVYLWSERNSVQNALLSRLRRCGFGGFVQKMRESTFEPHEYPVP